MAESSVAGSSSASSVAPAVKPTKLSPLYSNQHLFENDWGTVTTAWLQKFPDPNLKQVTSVETVARSICEETQSMHLRRLFNCSFQIPRLLRGFLGEQVRVICVEEAHWDFNKRRLTVHGRNETFQHVLRIDEVCCYTEVAPGQTLYTQSATVAYKSGVFGNFLMPMAKELCAGACQRNVHKGVASMIERVNVLNGNVSDGSEGVGTKTECVNALSRKNYSTNEGTSGSSKFGFSFGGLAVGLMTMGIGGAMAMRS